MDSNEFEELILKYLNILSSGNNKLIENKKTNGYIKILWYQHKEQGIKFIISEKNKLPRVEIKDIKKAKKIKVKLFESDLLSKSKDI